MVSFKKISSPHPVAEYLAGTLKSQLAAGKKVAWLVPGGSSIAIATDVSRSLEGADLRNLSVSLTDERYGPVGHPDSNWVQLARAGFILRGAKMLPVLSGKSRDDTAAGFARTLEQMLESADYRLGFFGIGADGHTAGILPGSTAVVSLALAAAYQGADFERVTMTPKAIAGLDEAVVYAVGQPKWPVLDELEKDLPLNRQPAQSLKQVPKLVIFNDYKGESV